MRETPRKRFAMGFRSRLALTGAVALMALPALTALQAPASAPVAPGVPTFTKDIAPILQAKCETCHRPDAAAPMSLISYEDVRPWARSIKSRTGLGPHAGVMPPWYAEKGVGIQDYQNDPSLSDEQIQKIAKWVDSGAPRGNPADMPPPVTFTDDWHIGKPDLIVLSPIVEMPAAGSDWWGTMGGDVPSGLTEDRYVEALQMREVTVSTEGDASLQSIGGRFIIHHWSIRSKNPGAEQVSLGEGERPVDGVGSTHEVGRNEDVFDPEVGRLMKAGALVT